MQLIDFDTDKFILALTVGGVRRSFTRAELVAVLAGAGVPPRSDSKSPWVAKLAAIVREVAKHQPIPAAEQSRLARLLDATREPEPTKTTSRLATTLESLGATEPALVEAIAAFVKRYPELR
mgnify:CR=1 FL=1